MDLKEYIRDIPDFPEPGILFRDITPLLRDPTAFKYAVDSLEDLFQAVSFDTVVAVESRGFLFGRQPRKARRRLTGVSSSPCCGSSISRNILFRALLCP